jgi:uncharacterized membrane protein YcaP (DUF421 family)
LPVVFLRDGELLEDFLSQERLRVDDVAEEARNQGIGDLRKVQVGVLEADGSMSFVLYGNDDGAPSQQQRNRAGTDIS